MADLANSRDNNLCVRGRTTCSNALLERGERPYSSSLKGLSRVIPFGRTRPPRSMQDIFLTVPCLQEED